MADRDELVALLVGGGRAGTAGDREALDAAVDRLLIAWSATGSAMVAGAVDRVFTTVLGSMWEGGWQPAEVVRAVRRPLTTRHVDLATTAVAAEPAAGRDDQPPAWRAQIDELGVSRWWGSADWFSAWRQRARLDMAESLVTTLETLGVMLGLPRTERLLPPPSAWRIGMWIPEGVDDPVLTKVRSLLAKAESTDFEAEAESCTAKAQELMRRHAIDEALAAPGAAGDSAGTGARPLPQARRIPVDDPYASAKSSLLASVAAANDVRCVWDSRMAAMTAIGFATDLEAVEALFTSLLVQATRQMVAERTGDRTRAFRHSFILAFASRIGERLAEAAEATRVAVEAERSVSLLPVLAGRRELVDEAVTEMFPRLGRHRQRSATSAEGWRAGRAAGDGADLGPAPARLGRGRSRG